MSKDLKSFRIGDLQPPSVQRGGPAPEPSPAPAPEEGSAGFPGIESRLEHSDMDGLIEAIRPRYEALEALCKHPERRTQAAAKKAMAAYERTADLFEYLFQTKDALGPEQQP